jgi:hypothetical protein
MNNYEVIHSGGNSYYYLNHILHRVDGPAVTFANGTVQWYYNDKLHRVDGPAVTYGNGSQYWYLHGVCYSESDFNQIMNNH